MDQSSRKSRRLLVGLVPFCTQIADLDVLLGAEKIPGLGPLIAKLMDSIAGRISPVHAILLA
jgi:hypothetical protein